MDKFWYDFIKRYFDDGLYVMDCAHNMYIGKFCEYGKLTHEQYKEITQQEYTEPQQ